MANGNIQAGELLGNRPRHTSQSAPAMGGNNPHHQHRITTKQVGTVTRRTNNAPTRRANPSSPTNPNADSSSSSRASSSFHAYHHSAVTSGPRSQGGGNGHVYVNSLKGAETRHQPQRPPPGTAPPSVTYGGLRGVRVLKHSTAPTDYFVGRR